jgi:hypothetical protein
MPSQNAAIFCLVQISPWSRTTDRSRESSRKASRTSPKQDLEDSARSWCHTVTWVPGKSHLIADALSRYPVFPPPEEEAEDTEEDKDKIVAGASLCRAISEDPNLSPLFEAAASDAEYGAVRKALLEGRLPKSLPPTHPARAYSSVWPDLSQCDDGLIILDGRRIVILDSQRSSVLELELLPHKGQTKTKEAARQLYYWPTMNNEITLMVEKCKECRKMVDSGRMS